MPSARLEVLTRFEVFCLLLPEKKITMENRKNCNKRQIFFFFISQVNAIDVCTEQTLYIHRLSDDTHQCQSEFLVMSHPFLSNRWNPSAQWVTCKARVCQFGSSLDLSCRDKPLSNVRAQTGIRSGFSSSTLTASHCAPRTRRPQSVPPWDNAWEWRGSQWPPYEMICPKTFAGITHFIMIPLLWFDWMQLCTKQSHSGSTQQPHLLFWFLQLFQTCWNPIRKRVWRHTLYLLCKYF